MRTVLHHCRIFTGEEILDDHVIVLDQDIIVSVQRDTPSEAHLVDLQGQNVSAGFIDIQVNDGEQYYFSQHPTTAALHDICHSSKRYGTTHVLPCLISSNHENILQAVKTIKEFMHTQNEGVLGMHLEGPFINPVKRGAHLASEVRKPTMGELEEIVKEGEGVIRVMTIAPECFEENQLDFLLKSGIVLSAGHSDMNYQQAQYYFSKGITLVTHLYNAMTQMQHRAPGLAGAVLNNANVYAPIILDGGHCDYAAAEIAWKMKKDKLFLISDAAFLSRKVKDFSWGEFNATLSPEGFYRNSEGNLAGAAISMFEALQNAVQHLKIPLFDAINMATINAARAIRMDDKIGRIAAGYPGRLVVFDNNLSYCKTMIV